MVDEKKPVSTTTKTIVIGLLIVVSLVGVYFIGRRIGYNKGFDKGVGWE